MFRYSLVIIIVLFITELSHSIDLKLPWTAGETWTVTVQYGGYCGGTCQDNYHTDANNAYYALDFDKAGALEGAGLPILAVADGEIISAGGDPSVGWGYYVKIKHDDGYISLYAHLKDEPTVSGFVTQGEQIGRMGSTGWSTGDHLHFVLYYNGDCLSTVPNSKPEPFSGYTNISYSQQLTSDNTGEEIPTPCIIGSVDTYHASGVSLSGNFIYIADGSAGIKVIDISNPTNPIIVGSVDTYSSNGISVSGNYAYVSDQAAGLKVIDISNPTNPVIVGSVDTYHAVGISLSGTFVYISDWSVGLKVIDISNPTNPIIVGSVDTDNAFGVFVSDNYAYVADGSTGLKVIDISNPANPIIVGSVIEANGGRVFVSGDYAYASTQNNEVKVIDISNPTNPVIVGSVDTNAAIHRIFVSGNYVYVANPAGTESRVTVIDISNPTNPVIAGSVDTEEALGVFVSGNYIYVADRYAGLKIFQKNCGTIPAVTTDFTATSTFGISPLTVQFFDQSNGNPISWLWGFGDGHISTEQNPSHTYIGGGNYTVSLTVGNGYITDTKVITEYVRVRLYNFKENSRFIKLDANHPNPFNPTTTITYSLPKAQQVSIIVYNSLGRVVSTLVNEVKESGSHTVVWNGRNENGHEVSSGVYFYRLVSAEKSMSRKMLFLK